MRFFCFLQSPGMDGLRRLQPSSGQGRFNGCGMEQILTMNGDSARGKSVQAEERGCGFQTRDE